MTVSNKWPKTGHTPGSYLAPIHSQKNMNLSVYNQIWMKWPWCSPSQTFQPVKGVRGWEGPFSPDWVLSSMNKSQSSELPSRHQEIKRIWSPGRETALSIGVPACPWGKLKNHCTTYHFSKSGMILLMYLSSFWKIKSDPPVSCSRQTVSGRVRIWRKQGYLQCSLLHRGFCFSNVSRMWGCNRILTMAVK